MSKKKQKSEITLDISVSDAQSIHDTLNTHSMVAMTDSKGIITYVNDIFCKVSKFKPSELIGQSHRVVKSDFHTREFYDKLWRTISSGKVWSADVRDKAKDGTYFWTRSAIMPRKDERSNIVGFVIIRTPITDLMSDIEKQIRQGVETDEIRALRNGTANF